ncbi:TPA: hypothetical protein ACTZ5W_005390 [Bacillus cereus]
MKQLTLDDVVGSFDYSAKSTADRFLQSDTSVITYSVEFYDKDDKWAYSCYRSHNCEYNGPRGRYPNVRTPY